MLDLASFCNHSLLLILNLHANRIRYLTDTSTHRCALYRSLLWLKLSQNMLMSVNMELFGRSTHMTHLDIRNNKIAALADTFIHRSLEMFDVDNNRLVKQSLCGWFLPKVTTLSGFEYNQLETVPLCAEKMINTTMLSLSGNCLRHFSIETVAQMRGLLMLDLSYNGLLTVFLGSVNFPPSLKTIYLSNNKLTSLDLTFILARSLTVNADTNLITSFSINDVSRNVTSLDMVNNPIDCSFKTAKDREHAQYLKSNDDTFVYKYIPSDLSMLFFTNVLLEHLDQSMLQAMPSFITQVLIINSPALKRVGVPNAAINLTTKYSSVRRIDIVADSFVDYLSISKCELIVCITAIQMRCGEIWCTVVDLKSNDDTFVYRYIPSDLSILYFTKVLLEHLDQSLLQAMPSFITHVWLGQSPALKRVSVPNVAINLTIVYCNVRIIDIVADSSVDYFSIFHGELVKIPRTVRNAPRLRFLEISSCKIDHLDLASLCANQHLHTLMLTTNKIRYIVNTARQHCAVYDSLLSISLKGNFIKTVNIALFNVFTMLDTLFLSGNKIRTVTGRLVNGSLRQLRLENNKLEQLDTCQWNVPTILLLMYYNNPMKLVPECLNDLQNFTAIV
uniref:Uncharacterized protein n=1 Tax=Anopheles christyi TaxID=43041 RepID=A0A182KH70_9DIPT